MITNTAVSTAFDARERWVGSQLHVNGELFDGTISSIEVSEVFGDTENLALGTTSSHMLTVRTLSLGSADLTDATLLLKFGAGETPDTKQFMPYGKFYVTSVQSTDDYKSGTITAMDGFCKLQGAYTPSGSIGAGTTFAALTDDVLLGSGLSVDWNASDTYAKSKSTSAAIPSAIPAWFEAQLSAIRSGAYTKTQIIGFIAARFGCNALFNRAGSLVFRRFTDTTYKVDRAHIYQEGFNRTTPDTVVLRAVTFQIPAAMDSSDAAVADTDEEGTSTALPTAPDGWSSTSSGSEYTLGLGRRFILTSPFFFSTDDAQEVYTSVLPSGSFTYQPGALKHRGNPCLEPGDVIKAMDRNGLDVTILLCGVAMYYDGGLYSVITSAGKSDAEDNYLDTGGSSSSGGLSSPSTMAQQLRLSLAELAAVRATIQRLYVQDLTAAHANINMLTADVANIQTIMSGQIGTGELQALHLTSGNVVIDDAVITDAMIADVSADKLQSGTIYTNLIHIMSGSGNLSLTDNTILFQDDAGVPRIQIGKDAQGDYNYYLWDADGNPMWNATGATEFGLNDGIIRDVAVAADANISGDKLNIQSVADALNEDGSLRVDSSQIIMDGTTLSAAFSSVSAKADEASDAVNGLSFGSRNYIRNSQTMVWPDYSLMSHDSGAVVGNALVGTAVVGASSDPASYFETVQTAAPSGETDAVLKLNRADGDTYRFRMNALIPGKYTFAVWLRSDSEVQVTIDQFGTVTEHTVGTEWTHIVVHAVAEAGKMDILIALSGGSTLYLYKGMLQTGSWDTDWKPAPEDTQEQIEAVATNVTTLRTEFSVVQGKVEAKIWQSDIDTAMGTIEEQYSQVTQTLDGITSRVGTLTTVTDGMSTRLTNAESSITQNAKQIALRVTANDVTSLIEQNADAIRLKASKISWQSDNSSMTESGVLTCTSGKIGGWNITSQYLYKWSSDGIYEALMGNGTSASSTFLCVAKKNTDGTTSFPFYVRNNGEVCVDYISFSDNYGAEDPIRQNYIHNSLLMFTNNYYDQLRLTANSLDFGYVTTDDDGSETYTGLCRMYTAPLGQRPKKGIGLLTPTIHQYIEIRSGSASSDPEFVFARTSTAAEAAGIGSSNIGFNLYRDMRMHECDIIDVGNISYASDRRLKSNILDTEAHALDTIRRMKFRKFDWKRSGLHEKLGLIAQELEQVDPYFVAKPQNENDTYSIYTNKLLYLALKAIQELTEGEQS